MEALEVLIQYKEKSKKTGREIAEMLSVSESQLNRWMNKRCVIGRLWGKEIKRKIKLDDKIKEIT